MRLFSINCYKCGISHFNDSRLCRFCEAMVSNPIVRHTCFQCYGYCTTSSSDITIILVEPYLTGTYRFFCNKCNATNIKVLSTEVWRLLQTTSVNVIRVSESPEMLDPIRTNSVALSDSEVSDMIITLNNDADFESALETL